MEGKTFTSSEVFWNSTKLHALQEFNRTQEKTNDYLERINNETFIKLLPNFVLFITLAVVGVLGNLLVFFVYLKQFKASATRVFVLAMAVCDFLTNIFMMPWLIQEIRYSYTIKAHFCIMKSLITTFPVIMSYVILVFVALDRRRRICQPLRRQLSARQATYTLIFLLTLTFAIVIPFTSMYSIIPLDTELFGKTGTTCGFSTLTSSKMFIKQVLGTVLIILSATEFVILTACYTQISYRIYQQKKKLFLAGRINFTAVSEVTKTHLNKSNLSGSEVEQTDSNMSKQSSICNVSGTRASEFPGQDERSRCFSGSKVKGQQRSVASETPMMMPRGPLTMLPTTENANLSETSPSYTNIFKSTSTSTDNKDEGEQRRSDLVAERAERSHWKTTILSRTTLMMLVLTIATLVCLLPNCVLTLANVQYVGVNLSLGKMNIYFFLHYFPLVSSVLNPFIYSFCSPKFRRESRRLLMKMRNTLLSKLILGTVCGWAWRGDGRRQAKLFL